MRGITHKEKPQEQEGRESTSLSLEIRWRVTEPVILEEALSGPGEAEDTWDEVENQRSTIVAQIIPDPASRLCLCSEKCFHVPLHLRGESGKGRHGLQQRVLFPEGVHHVAQDGAFTSSNHSFFLPKAIEQIVFKEINITQLEKELCQFPEYF